MSREPEATGTRGRAAAPAPIAEWEPEVAYEPTLPPAAWDGTCTRLPIAYPMIRNHRVVGEGDMVIFQACKDAVGRWIGPEAQHVEDLFQQGMILGSQAQAARAAATAAIEHQRGVHQALERDKDGSVVQRPMTELAARTKEQVQREWERPLAAHIADDNRRARELRRRERQEARSGEEGAEDVAAALAKLLQGSARRAAGSEGPGTAPVPEE